MKTFVLLLLLLLSAPAPSQNPFGEKPKPKKTVPEKIHEKPEVMPLFPGGPTAMQKYLEDHINRPSIMRGICSSRRLIAGFVVEKDGSLSKIDIIKSIDGCPDFDYDVIRVIKSMPKWTPAKQDGRYVRCYYKMPVYIG